MAMALRADDPPNTPATIEVTERWREFNPSSTARLLALAAEWDDRDDEDETPEDVKIAISFAVTYGILARNHKLPDAFTIDIDARTLTAHEVIASHDFCPSHYVTLWFLLDCEDWSLQVKAHSCHGGLLGEYADEHFAELYLEDLFDPQGEA